MKEVLGSSFDLSKNKKSHTREEVIVGGLIMIGLEMGLIKQPPPPNLTSTPSVSRDNEDPFILPSPKHTVFKEIINERVNSEAESSTTNRSPSKSELRKRSLNYQLEKMRIKEEEEAVERVRMNRKGRELPMLIRPEARRVERRWQDEEEDYSTEGNSTPTPVVSSKAQKSRTKSLKPTADCRQYQLSTHLDLSSDHTKGQSQSHPHFHPPPIPNTSASTSYLTSFQSHVTHLPSSHSHPRISVKTNPTTTIKSKRQQFEESEYMNLIPSELEIQKFEKSKAEEDRRGSGSISHDRKVRREEREGKENVLNEKRVEVILDSENSKEGWEWTAVTVREVALRLEQEGKEYELELERKKIRLMRVLERLRKKDDRS